MKNKNQPQKVDPLDSSHSTADLKALQEQIAKQNAEIERLTELVMRAGLYRKSPPANSPTENENENENEHFPVSDQKTKKVDRAKDSRASRGGPGSRLPSASFDASHGLFNSPFPDYQDYQSRPQQERITYLVKTGATGHGQTNPEKPSRNRALWTPTQKRRMVVAWLWYGAAGEWSPISKVLQGRDPESARSIAYRIVRSRAAVLQTLANQRGAHLAYRIHYITNFIVSKEGLKTIYNDPMHIDMDPVDIGTFCWAVRELSLDLATEREIYRLVQCIFVPSWTDNVLVHFLHTVQHALDRQAIQPPSQPLPVGANRKMFRKQACGNIPLDQYSSLRKYFIETVREGLRSLLQKTNSSSTQPRKRAQTGIGSVGLDLNLDGLRKFKAQGQFDLDEDAYIPPLTREQLHKRLDKYDRVYTESAAHVGTLIGTSSETMATGRKRQRYVVANVTLARDAVEQEMMEDVAEKKKKNSSKSIFKKKKKSPKKGKEKENSPEPVLAWPPLSSSSSSKAVNTDVPMPKSSLERELMFEPRPQVGLGQAKVNVDDFVDSILADDVVGHATKKDVHVIRQNPGSQSQSRGQRQRHVQAPKHSGTDPKFGSESSLTNWWEVPLPPRNRTESVSDGELANVERNLKLGRRFDANDPEEMDMDCLNDVNFDDGFTEKQSGKLSIGFPDALSPRTLNLGDRSSERRKQAKTRPGSDLDQTQSQPFEMERPGLIEERTGATMDDLYSGVDFGDDLAYDQFDDLFGDFDNFGTENNVRSRMATGTPVRSRRATMANAPKSLEFGGGGMSKRERIAQAASAHTRLRDIEEFLSDKEKMDALFREENHYQ